MGRAITYQCTEGERVIEGETITSFGSHSILVSRADGEVHWSWDDDASPRHRRRDHRRARRFLRRLPPVTWGAADDDGGLVSTVGRFEPSPEAT